MTSATAAYRKDAAANAGPFGDDDAHWIGVAILAENAARADGEESDRILRLASREIQGMLGEPDLTRRARREWGEGWSEVDAVGLFGTVMLEAGALNLAASVLDSALSVLGGRRDVTTGRLMAQRARVAYVAGEHDLAEARYRDVEQIGRALRRPELRARSAIGLAALSHVRGNHPAYLQHAERALRLADESGYDELRLPAHYALMMAYALRRRFEDALIHGWEVVRLSGAQSIHEAAALLGIGELLLESGDVGSARAAFATVVARELPPKVLLPALGGLAITAAKEGDVSALEWAVAEVAGMRDSAVPPFAYAGALLECATALRDAGHHARAEELRSEVLALARVRGFHELVHRAEALEITAPRSLVPAAEIAESPQTADILRALREMEPERLPRHVRMAAAR